MERYVEEFEPQVKALFSEANFKGFDLASFMSNVAMDFLEDLVEHDNVLSPQELIETPKFHCLKRFIKEGNVYNSFLKMAKEYWDMSRVNK